MNTEAGFDGDVLTVRNEVPTPRSGLTSVVTGMKGWHGGGAGMRRNSTPLFNAHGAFSERGLRDERLISVEGRFFNAPNDTLVEIADTIESFLADGREGELVVVWGNQGKRSSVCYLFDAPEITWNSPRSLTYSLDLVCPDPRKYGDPVGSATGVPKDGGGLQYDLYASESGPGLLDYGAAGDSGVASFQNLGTADTAPTLRVNGFAPGFTITELSTGNRLVYTDVVPSGSYVLLDPRSGAVLLDGYADRSPALAVREWTRTPRQGTSSFLFESDGPNAKLTVEGRPAWW